MKLFISALSFFSLACAHSFEAAPQPPQNQPPVKTVDSVDLTRYLGKWFEIATITQSFQKKCVGGTTAEYSQNNDQTINVVNTCNTKKGKNIANGLAHIIDTETNAKLKVTFVKLFDWIFAFGGDYWIIELDTNYNWAVVGSKNRKYGWILSRQKSLSNYELHLIADKIKSQGYDLCKFNTTPQDGGFSKIESLCNHLSK